MNLEKGQSTGYRLMLQFVFEKGDFFFCHWKAIDKKTITDRLSVASLKQLIVTMVTPVNFPKMNLCFVQPMINKSK